MRVEFVLMDEDGQQVGTLMLEGRLDAPIVKRWFDLIIKFVNSDVRERLR